MQDKHRETLTITLDGRTVTLVPEVIEGYRLEVDGRSITSFLSHTPPLLRALATLEGRGEFGVGDLETASEMKNWTVTGAAGNNPAEKN